MNRDGKIALLLVFMVMNTASAQPAPRTNPALDNWTIAAQQFRTVDEPIMGTRVAKGHRLICESLVDVVASGDPIRLRLGVERIADDTGQALSNPFIDIEFPQDICIAVYNEQHELVTLLPREPEKEPVDAEVEYALEGHETRGKVIELPTRTNGQDDDPFLLDLPPGTYKFQLIARCHFFLARQPHQIKQAKTWLAVKDYEALRSDTAIVQIKAPNPDSPKPIEPDVRHEGKLVASVTIRKNPEFTNPDKSVKYQTWLQVANSSTVNSIALIDPFFRKIKVANHPIPWSLRRFGNSRNLAGVVWAGGSLAKSDLLVLPPGGFASAPVLPIPNEPGRYEVKVDFQRGLLTDTQEIDDVLSGLRRIDDVPAAVVRDAIHPDSELSCRIVID